MQTRRALRARSSFVLRAFRRGRTASLSCASLPWSASSSSCLSCSSKRWMPLAMVWNNGVSASIILPWYFVM